MKKADYKPRQLLYITISVLLGLCHEYGISKKMASGSRVDIEGR